MLNLTICLDNNFGEKIKEGKGKRKRKGMERNKRKVTLVCLGGNEKKMKGNKRFPSKSPQLWRDRDLKKYYSSKPSKIQIPSLPFFI